MPKNNQQSVKVIFHGVCSNDVCVWAPGAGSAAALYRARLASSSHTYLTPLSCLKGEASLCPSSDMVAWVRRVQAALETQLFAG